MSSEADSQELNIEETPSARGALLSLVLVALALLLWAISLSGVDLRAMTDLGLVSVLSPLTYAALAILLVSFCLALQRRQVHTGLMLLHVAALVLIIHGTPQILYGTLRYTWTWKHIGLIDYIQRHGSVDPSILNLGAYHNWPGFFALGALFTEVAGYSTALSFAGWGPVFFSLLDIGAILLILKTFSSDRRLIWLSIWFFFLTNWVGLEYFSPQALVFFLYLIIIGVVLGWFRLLSLPSEPAIKRWLRFDWAVSLFRRIVAPAAPGDAPPASQPLERVGLMAIVILLLAVIASSHQLTPLLVIVALTLLVVFQVTHARGLPIVMIVLTMAWIIYMAAAFVNGNIYWIADSIGALMRNVQSNLINLSDASPGQAFVAAMNRRLTVLIWGLAIVGFIRRLRQGHWDLPAALLIVAPFPLALANSYGGEIVFRVYLFSLPFITFFAAALLYPSPKSGKSWRTTAAALLLSGVLLVGLLYAYYGKERAYHFTADEIEASQVLYDTAPAGSFLVDGIWNWPQQYRSYEQYDSESLLRSAATERQQLLADPVAYISDIMMGHPSSYLIISRAQKAYVDMIGIVPAGSLDKVEQALLNSPKFRVIYTNPDARIFVLAGQSNTGGQR